MKRYIKIVLVIILVTTFYSCTKDRVNVNGGTSLIVVNTIKGTTSLIPNFSSGSPLKYYRTAFQLNYGSWSEFSGYLGEVPISFTDISDTTHSIVTANLNLIAGSIYTLFLTGTTNQPDTLYIKEHIPNYKPTDSVTGVRFVNLSMGGNSISINLQGNNIGSEVSSLSYKHFTSFKAYPATSILPSSGQYIFEIRDASTSDLLTTCSYTTNTGSQTNVFKNVTVVVYGQENDANNPITAFIVNNF